MNFYDGKVVTWFHIGRLIWKGKTCWHSEICMREPVWQIHFAEEPSRQRGEGGDVMWKGQESWISMDSSGMNSTPAMAPLSPGLSSSQPLTPMSPKNTTFQSLGSLSAGMFSPSLATGGFPQVRQSSSPLNCPSPSIMSSPKLWHKASISRLAEEFFWIGGSVVAQPKWRLGQIGKIH